MPTLVNLKDNTVHEVPTDKPPAGEVRITSVGKDTATQSSLPDDKGSLNEPYPATVVAKEQRS